MVSGTRHPSLVDDDDYDELGFRFLGLNLGLEAGILTMSARIWASDLKYKLTEYDLGLLGLEAI